MDVCRIISFALVILANNPLVATHECSKSESIACRQEIQDFQEDKNRYSYTNDNETLDKMCRKQLLAVNCVKSFAEECLSEKEKAYFKTMILGSDEFLDAFCFEDSQLRKKYLEHSGCLRLITQELDDCSQQYQISQKELDDLESDNEALLEKTCCIYFKNIQCSSNITAKVCGREAANLVTELFTLLSGTYLTGSCQPYSNYEQERCVPMSKSGQVLPCINILIVSMVFHVFCQRLKPLWWWTETVL